MRVNCRVSCIPTSDRKAALNRLKKRSKDGLPFVPTSDREPVQGDSDQTVGASGMQIVRHKTIKYLGQPLRGSNQDAPEVRSIRRFVLSDVSLHHLDKHPETCYRPKTPHIWSQSTTRIVMARNFENRKNAIFKTA